MSVHAHALHFVAHPRIGCGEAQKAPHHDGHAHAVEKELLDVPRLHKNQDGQASHCVHRAGKPPCDPAPLVQMLAHREPKRRDGPASGCDGGDRAADEKRRGHTPFAVEEVVLEHQGDVEEVEQEAEREEHPGSGARHQGGSETGSRRQDDG